MEEAEGTRGALRLVFRPGPGGATVLARAESRAPLRVLNPFPLGGGEVLLQLLNVGPGVLAGDVLELDVHVASGAAAVLVAQSATKLHAMDAPSTGEQRVRLRVEAGGSLEYHPGLAIPFAGSAFRQRVEVGLETGARFAALERWSVGRVGRGERGAFRHLSSRLRVTVDGAPVYADAVELGADAAHTGVMDGKAYLATGVFFGGEGPGASRAPEPPDDGGDVLAVGSFGPGRHYLRGLTDDGLVLRRALEATANGWRAAEGRPSIAFGRYGS